MTQVNYQVGNVDFHVTVLMLYLSLLRENVHKWSSQVLLGEIYTIVLALKEHSQDSFH